jgi:alpha-glucosidase
LKPYNARRPEGHGVLRDMRAILDSYPGDRVLLGESATANIGDLRAVYGEKNDEINLPMDFLVGNLTRLDAAVFKRQYDDAQLKLDGLPPVVFFSSHDHSRQWTSFGDGKNNDQIAKLTATLTLTQRGTALLYYGEELGMGDIPEDLLKSFPLGPRRPRADDRDRARTPMQWTSAATAGFSSGAPWLPVAPQSRRYNVAAETGNPDSILAWYRQLLQLRHKLPALNSGAYLALESGNPELFAFARVASDGRGALVVVNASSSAQTAAVAGWSGATPMLKSVLMASPAMAVPNSTSFRLEPFGILIAGF